MYQIHLKNALSALSFLFFMAGSSFAQSPVGIDRDSANTIIFTKVDKPAEFPGGTKGWSEYLQKNLVYPNKAIKKNIQGVVRVQFLVDKAGNISEVQALNNPGGGLAEESVRIIANGPKWRPAEQNGRKVIYRHIQAITFKLE